jgi:hypothetical protein
MTTLKDAKTWMEHRSELGWTIVQTCRFDDEPLFDDNGVTIDIVNVFDYHYNDENGNYVGCLQVVIGDDYTEASFEEMSFDDEAIY